MRDARQVYDDHWASIRAGDMDRILADYADAAVFIRPNTVARGRTEIRGVFDELGDLLAGFDLTQESVTVDGPLVLFEWSGRNPDGRTARGADTFYITDDRIRLQTLSYSISDS